MAAFQLLLKNEKKKLYDQLTWFLIIINELGFLYFGFYTDSKEERYKSLVSAVLILLLVLSKFVFRKGKLQLSLFTLFSFITIFWLIQLQFLLAAIMFVFDLLYFRVRLSFSVIFSIENIIYPSFPAKKIKWADLTNVILKDGLLTIDFKNNRLIQQMLDEETQAVNEKEFNEFCQQQLRSDGS